MRELNSSNQRVATARTLPGLLRSRSAAAAPRPSQLSAATSTGAMFNGKLPPSPHKPARWATENKIAVAEAAFLLKHALKCEAQLTAKAKARALTRAPSAPRLNELARTRAVLGAERRYQPAAMNVYEGESGEIAHAALEAAWHGAAAARQEMERREEERRATERATYGVGLTQNPRLARGAEESLAARPGAADPAADAPPGPSLLAGRRPAPARAVGPGPSDAESPPLGASSRAGPLRHSSAISAGALRPEPMSSPAILQVVRSPARKYVTPGLSAAMESEAREQARRIRSRDAAAFLSAPSTPANARAAARRKAEVAQWKRQQAEAAEAELVRRALTGETAQARHARAILYHTSRDA